MLRIRKLSGEEVASLPLAELSDVKALKQRLHQQHGLPPRFRQRLLHESKALDDSVTLDSVFDLQVVAALSYESTEETPRQLTAEPAAQGSEGGGALKQQSDPEDGATPSCRQSFLHDGHSLEDAVRLETPMDLQILIVDFTKDDSWTKLWAATMNGDVAQAEALLQLPIDPSLTPNRAGTTPLMMASGGGYVDIVQLLLEAGASIDHRNRYGHTALMDSARFGHVPVVQLLLGAGAQKELRDVAGLTALMMAADGGHAQAVRLLLEAGAAKDVRNLAGQTALMMTSEPEVRLLLKPIRLDFVHQQ